MRNIFKMTSEGIPCDGGFYQCKVLTQREEKPKGWYYTLEDALKAGRKKSEPVKVEISDLVSE